MQQLGRISNITLLLSDVTITYCMLPKSKDMSRAAMMTDGKNGKTKKQQCWLMMIKNSATRGYTNSHLEGERIK
jgi:hypothetical protein